jgi:hypothetical protein
MISEKTFCVNSDSESLAIRSNISRSRIFRRLLLGLSVAVLAVPAFAQQYGSDSDKTDSDKTDSNKNDKPLDVRSSIGDLHVGKDADAERAGLPLYPGARAKRDDNSDPLNVGIATDSFGLKLIVANYQSDDPAEKVLAFYRDKMKKYGKVLECHNANDDSGSHNLNDDSERNQPLKCEGDNNGPVRELKVGTEGNAHVVAIEDGSGGKGTTFSIVYWHNHGKSGDI